MNRATIEAKAHQAAASLQLDPMSQPTEFKALMERIFSKYDQQIDEQKAKKRMN